jgi:putative restriction endonuclease
MVWPPFIAIKEKKAGIYFYNRAQYKDGAVEEKIIMAKIECMYLRGKGDTFRFFAYDQAGNLVSVLAKGDGEKYQNGDEVPESLIKSITPPNVTQSKWWKNPKNRRKFYGSSDLAVLNDGYPSSGGESLNDNEQGELESGVDGKPGLSFRITYERDSHLREQAIKTHGLTCMVCGFNFEKTYGDYGKDYIHVHHRVPVSEGEQTVNPKDDLCVVCANCHAMIHRRRDNTLTLEELKAMIEEQKELRE